MQNMYVLQLNNENYFSAKICSEMGEYFFSTTKAKPSFREFVVTHFKSLVRRFKSQIHHGVFFVPTHRSLLPWMLLGTSGPLGGPKSIEKRRHHFLAAACI